jgi:hypothetical protein
MVNGMDNMRSCHCLPQRITASQFSALTALRVTAALLGVVLTLVMSKPSLADEGGASMYLAGSFGSLAAVPGEPGWSLALVYYHAKGSLGTPSVGYASERSDLGYGVPAYAFATPVLGGQLALSMAGAIGRIQASIDGVAEDSRFGYNDLLPGATLRWSAGVNNYMAYGLGEIPSGTYDRLRLANFGIGHAGIDGGGGYTYFDQKAGYEFSVVAGLTTNMKNTYTDYQNGIDSHIDWGGSRFLSKDLHIGLVGYYYQQLTADRGQPSILGDFKSRVAAVGPQIGYFFPIGDAQGYVNLKAYSEFDAENRPAGLNAWLTFVISPKAPEAAPPRLGRPPLGH